MLYQEDKLSFIVWINIALGSTLGSAGAAPVPNAGVIMLITVWETALPGFAVPDAIAYVQVIICIFYFILVLMVLICYCMNCRRLVLL
jgi:hypothetical protein